MRHFLPVAVLVLVGAHNGWGELVPYYEKADFLNVLGNAMMESFEEQPLGPATTLDTEFFSVTGNSYYFVVDDVRGHIYPTHGDKFLVLGYPLISPSEPMGSLVFDFEDPVNAIGMVVTDWGDKVPGGTLSLSVDGEEPITIFESDGDDWYDSRALFFGVIDNERSFRTVEVMSTTLDEAMGCDEVYFAEPPWTDVTIDIKPGSDPNSINLGSNGNVPIAIFSLGGMDATTIDPLSVSLANATVRLRGKGVPMTSFQDVNLDGLDDMVVHVETEALELTAGDVEAWLAGTLTDGTPIRGVDSVRIVPQDGGTVPEPATLVLLSVGVIALAAYRLRRQRTVLEAGTR